MNQRQRSALAQRYESDGMAGSSPQKLLLAVFQRLRSDLEGASAAIVAGRVEEAHQLLLHAQDLVHELDLALDTDTWEGGTELRALYRHLMAVLMEANLTKSAAMVGRGLDIVVPLGDTWSEAYRLLNDEPAPSIT
ncbi:MAG: flagellar export chaperone FliS [Actinomycetota bacterium]